MRILVIEDEPDIGAGLVRSLGQAGFVAELARDGESGWAMGDLDPFSAAVLDLNLPRLDGLSVLRRWRADGIAMPVLVLSARSSWTERVDALDAGADDYLVKPFAVEELVARLNAILRRGAGLAANEVRDGDLVVDLRRRTVRTAAGPVELTALEFRLLRALLARPGEALSQADLSQAVYGDHETRRDNAIEAAVMRLRRKVGRQRIETRRGFGYAWQPAGPGSPR